MNIEQARAYCLTLPGVTEDMPYGPDWVVFRVGGKIFMHIWLMAPQPAIAVKLLPDVGAALREQYATIRPAYHLNKRHWNDILITNSHDDAQIQGWDSRLLHPGAFPSTQEPASHFANGGIANLSLWQMKLKPFSKFHLLGNHYLCTCEAITIH